MSDLPTGTVTFLFTDIEGSTRLAQSYPSEMPALLARHHAFLHQAIEAHGGYVFQIIGDAFCAAFHTASDALQAAIEAQRNLQLEAWSPAPISVRMGLHTGAAQAGAIEERAGGYVGYLTLTRVQRVMSAAYGGQALLSNSTAELVRGELPAGASLRDMGEHRLKGLLNPEHLWQVVAPDLPEEFPPLKSLNGIPNNLPVQLTSFIGREREIGELEGALNDHRLVTLTGSGGTGKTRLSLQVAAQVLDAYPDGVWFVELAPVTDPALVPNTVASLLGLRESAETKQSISELLCGYFRDRKALIILDNCEHLIEACAKLADLLLRSCKEVKILASSREALGLAGELAWHVPSLSLPDVKQLPEIDQMTQYESVRLFIDRASLVQPHFAVTTDNAPAIAQVCSRLDGIPLAIELAAARANVLGVDQIAKRLDDRFRLLTGGSRTALPRQQTLRAMIDWSYNLLSEQEQLLFRRLAVFVGGWTLEAAEKVCGGDGIEDYELLDLLAQLVRKSLAAMHEGFGGPRYLPLETVRQYARDKLFETDEAASLRERHLDYFIEVAEQGYEGLHGPEDVAWMKRLEAEQDNLRAALSWALESPDVDSQKALQLSGALQDFWDVSGALSEGHGWLQEALQKAPDSPTLWRARALNGDGLLRGIRLGQAEAARPLLEAALAISRRLGDPTQLIISLLYSADLQQDLAEFRKYMSECLMLARSRQDAYFTACAMVWDVFWFSEDESAALRTYAEALKVAEDLGNSRLRALILWAYSQKLLLRGSYDLITASAQEGMRLSQLLGDKHTAAHCLLVLGKAATQQGHFDEAVGYEEQSLRIFIDLSDPECRLRALFALAWRDFLTGELDVAHAKVQECLSTSRGLGLYVDALFMPRYLLALGQIAARRGDYEEARGLILQALEAWDSRTDPVGLAIYLEAVCALPALPSERSARLMGKAQAIREKEGFVVPASERFLVDPVVERLQAQLTREAYASARAAGAALSHKAAIRDAIEALGAAR
jgi:predicted ATPase/class 3 adenylate cyclase